MRNGLERIGARIQTVANMEQQCVKSLLLGLCLMVAAVGSSSLVGAEPASPENTGLAVGRPAPAFTLRDQHGQEIALESLLKNGPVAVVFYRSAGWCMYCKLQLVQLQEQLKSIKAVGGQVIAISYDSAEVIKSFATRSKITFPLLTDPGSKTIDAYEVRNTEAPAGYDGISYHTTFIVDQKGVIRSKLFFASFREKQAMNTLLTALKESRAVTATGR